MRDEKLYLIKRKAKKYGFIAGAILIAALVAGIYFYQSEEEVSTEYILSTLEKSSELTTAKLNYEGFSKFTDEGTPIINKGDFSMLYQATARIGIDMDKVEVKKNSLSKEYVVKIPKAEVLDVSVDPGTIEYYNEKFVLFNVNQKEDANKAQKLAEEQAMEKVAEMGVLEMADDQAELVIKGLLSEVISDDYELVIERF